MWATPIIAVGAAAPSTAASTPVDIIVAKTGCYDPAVGTNTLGFSVTAQGADLPAGAVLRFSYSGGNNYPEAKGTLPGMSNVVENRQGMGAFAGVYGTMTFTLKQPILARTTQTVTFSYCIGPAAQRDQATFAIVSGLTAANNTNAGNDKASYTIGSGSCAN